MLYQRGKEKTWWYRFRFGGRIVHESAKTQSKTVAREAAKQRRRKLEETWNHITRRTLPPTFEKAANEWLKGREGRFAPSTLTIGRVSIMHLTPAFGEKLLCDITPKTVEAYQQARLREGAQGRTVNIEVQALRQVLKAHKCWKDLEGEIHGLKERKDVGRALTPEEEGPLLGECAKADSACYTAVVLALNTTMRKDEIRRLQWKQVDLFDGVLTVGKSKTDAGTGRAIPLNPAVRRALADWGEGFPSRQPEHYVFPLAEGNSKPDFTRPPRDGARLGEMPANVPVSRCASMTYATRPLRSWPKAKPQTKPSWRLLATSAGRCWNTTRISEWPPSAPPWMPSQLPCLRPLLVEKWPILGHMCTKMVTKSRWLKRSLSVNY